MCVTTFVAAAIARVPHVVFCIRTVNPSYGWAEPALAERLREAHCRMAPAAARIVVNSNLLREDYAAWAGMDADRIAVCANGIDIDARSAAEATAARARVRAAFGICDAAVVIANVGRFSPEKGQLSLVEANRLLRAGGSSADVVWLLCGDGPTLADVQAAAASLGMTNIVFASRTTEVGDILAASDMFVMPSDFEGMPNAMMEAMAAGLPCVSTMQSGARDVARDGIEALYYDAGDTASLAGHIQELLANPERGRAMAARARERVGQFSVERLVQSFETILDGLPTLH